MIHVFYTKFDQDIPDETFALYEGQLPAEMLERSKRFLKWEDRYANILGKILLKYGLQELNISQQLHEITYSSYKKPRLAAPVDFNISHSNLMVVCAISTHCRTGIDVECIKQININDFSSQFTALEMSEIHHSSNELLSFYNLWTCKEAVMKADGRGMYIPLEEIIIKNNSCQLTEKWHLSKLNLDSDYIINIASSIPTPIHTYYFDCKAATIIRHKYST